MGKKIFFTFFIVVFFLALFVSSDFNGSRNEQRLLSNRYLVEAMYDIDFKEAKDYINFKLITINYEGEIKTHISNSGSPITSLIDLGYSLSNKNIVISTSPINKLYNNSFILVESYTSTIDEIILAIPYTVIVEGTTLCESLQTQSVQQEGVLGAMTQRIKRTYKGDELIAEEVIEENTTKEAKPKIIVIKGPDDTPDSVPQRGYNCTYWETYIDNISASEEERKWLKFTMKLESGCNAESNKSYYKGLFQWDPCLWYKLYPDDNIFDGEAQIKRTLQKIRAGANPRNMWPAVYKRYVEEYGELSWLQSTN